MEKYIKRLIEPQILSVIKRDYIAAISGARQTGKTTLMEKLQKDLLNQGFPKSRIFFYNLDDVILRQRIAADFYFLRNQIEERLGQNRSFWFGLFRDSKEERGKFSWQNFSSLPLSLNH